MKIQDYLSSLTYPGRTIVAGKDKNGELFYAYAIMGRSINSRNRVFRVLDNKIETKAYDESLVEDPHLIIYNATISCDDFEIFTNGDQSDTIYNHLINNSTFEDALNEREYEDDAPNYTPRISGTFFKDGKLKLSILKRENETCKRLYFTYDQLNNDEAYVIHTYEDDGNPLPSFQDGPRKVEVDFDSIEQLCTLIHNSLNKENRISTLAKKAFDSSKYIINSKEL